MRISDWSSDVCSSDLEGEGLAVVGDGPGLRCLAVDLRHVLEIVGDQAVGGVAGELGGAELEDLSGIERDDVVEGPGHDQRVARGLGLRWNGGGGHYGGHDAGERSEGRRVGKEWVSTIRSRWVAFPLKKHKRTSKTEH